MFPQLPDRYRAADLESDVQHFWTEHEIFRKSVESRPEEKSWTFYEGPPTANGSPGSSFGRMPRLVNEGARIFSRFGTPPPFEWM